MARGFTMTQEGKKLLAELVTTGELKITRVMVGKGEVQQGQLPEQFTDLIEPVAQATATIPVVKNGVISFIVEYRNDLNGGLQEGFWLKEFGVFAQDGEKEILLYYASLGEYPQYIEVYENGKVNIKKYPVSIVVADDVKVTIAYAALAFVTEERMKEFVEIEALPYLEGVLAESENSILAELDKKADKETVEQALNTKADVAIIQQALDQKANAQAVQIALDKKVDKESFAEELAKKANAQTVIEELAKKADAETMQQALDQKADEMETLTELGKKVDKETLIEELAKKADKEDVQTELDKKVDKEEIEEILQQQIDGANISLELDKKADKETVTEELEKKANAAHEHSADEITDGILPIERGGTGAATAADARTNLEITPANIGAAPSSHGTHVTFSTTAPVMDGTASVGTATTVSRSDHKHPTDTSRAAASHTHNYAGSSSAGGAATSAIKLQTARTMEGVNFDGSGNITHFGVCETEANVAAKVVNVPHFSYVDGARILVLFTKGTTLKQSTTLNVNNLGAKNIIGAYNRWPTNLIFEAGNIIELVYYKSLFIITTANAISLAKIRTIDGMNFDGSTNITHFGVCSTAAGTAAKTVSLSGFVLAEGARIAVYFANANTAGSPTLNVNGTGAHYLAYRNGSFAVNGQWGSGDIVEFVYYNNHWIMLTANARRLTTARTIQTNLGSASSASFDGTANITPGVTGTLPIANGGTGATSASAARTALGAFSSSGGTISGNVKINGTVAEGGSTTASGTNAHAEGGSTTASGTNAHAEGGSTTASGSYSHAEGYKATASGSYSHAEGYKATAGGRGSHAEGAACVAYKFGSHAEGTQTIAANHVLKVKSVDTTNKKITFDNTYNGYSTAFGKITVNAMLHILRTDYTAEADRYTIASIDTTNHAVVCKEAVSGNLSYAVIMPDNDNLLCAHAEGHRTIASASYSHAEGYCTAASGSYSHAEGYYTKAINADDHAEGDNTVASGGNSHAANYHTKASALYQTAIGAYNKESTAETDKFIIGNGTSDTTRSNCLRVTNASGVYSNSTYKSSGADYAELFQWLDDNPEKEDRVGLFVTLVGERIRIAEPTDKYILGIISGCPSVLGDVYDDQWKGMYEIDIYGRPIMEEVEVPERKELREVMKEPIYDENGNEIEQEKEYEEIIVEEAHTEIQQKLNPEYDPTQEYIPRSERPEWAVVGMMGKLVVIDDGSCEENDWCTAGKDGIAVKSETQTKCRVMKRLDENHIKVLVL